VGPFNPTFQVATSSRKIETLI